MTDVYLGPKYAPENDLTVNVEHSLLILTL